MRNLDFTSWQSLFTTLLGLAVFTLIGVGARLIAMMTIQQRRERQNRQINERLRTLIAAYKVLGGSFTGDLSVDPSHLRDMRRRADAAPAAEPVSTDVGAGVGAESSDRARRIRDAVEAALSDIILLGTEEQVKLAADAAIELVAGRPVPTHALVVSLRNFIRSALDLDPIGAHLTLPMQGPTRPAAAGNRAKQEQVGGRSERAGGGMNGGLGGSGMDTGSPATLEDIEHKR